MKIRQCHTIFLTVLSLLLISEKAYSQKQDSTFVGKKNILFVSILPLIDVINPNLSIGYERSISNKIAIQLEGGPILRHSLLGYFVSDFLGLGTRGAWWTNSGYKVRSELKYYLRSNLKRRTKTYYALGFFKTENSSNVTQLYNVSDETYDYSEKDINFAGEGIYEDFYLVKRTRTGVNFKIGFQDNYAKIIALDSYVGLGIVYQSLSEFDRANYNDEPFEGNWPFLRPGKRLLPTVTVGIKVGIGK